MLQLTPGVQMEVKQDDLGQQYNTPEHAVIHLGADIVVVGRGITKAQDPLVMAAKYQEILWKAYLARIETQ